jgi:DNA-binding NtrC family response regulator
MVSPSCSACADGDPTGVKSIMVLDEDEESRTTLEQSLDELGHRTTLFLSLSDLQIPEFDFAGFDLVICDLDKTPGVWKHLLNRIRAQRLGTQLILTSRTAAEREWLEALQVGAFDLLAKPYLKSEVLRVTSNALAMNYNRRFTAT